MQTSSATLTALSGMRAEQVERLEPGWFSMRTAPRDGTVIEVRVKFGLEPSFHKFFWRNDGLAGARWSEQSESGFEMYIDDAPAPRMGAGTSHMMWRLL